MSNSLQDRIAIVTGSSSGNGRAIALKLSAAGAIVICADRTKKARKEGYEKDLETDTDDVIRLQGGTVRYIQADVGYARDVEDLVAHTVLEFGRLDLLVNNAGVNTGLHTIAHETEEQFDHTMNVNVKGVWLGCKFAIIQMLRQEPLVSGSRGKIVNVASVGGLVGILAAPAYCASKGAVVNLTRQLAADFSPHKINVNAVCPGYIATAMSRDGLENEEFHQFVQQITPWPRLGTCDDVAESVLFFLSSEANWISGSILAVDGGLTAR
jgi:NAD(P)-dependent dehydrogenase (short-subunit alcohol dehydrogenase family)